MFETDFTQVIACNPAFFSSPYCYYWKFNTLALCALYIYQMQQVNDINKLCTDDFEWYLELWPIYYKAVYYLAKINMKIDDSKCRALLLQLPRKANDAAAAAATAAVGAEKKLSLFDVHRNRQLFKVRKSNTHQPLAGFG